MYDMYPEWGPAQNRDEHDADARDTDFQRPDDN